MQNLIPQWLTRPATALSTMAALAGAGLILWAAVTGAYWWAVWGVVSFIGAGLLWYVADYAASPSSLEVPPAGSR